MFSKTADVYLFLCYFFLSVCCVVESLKETLYLFLRKYSKGIIILRFYIFMSVSVFHHQSEKQNLVPEHKNPMLRRSTVSSSCSSLPFINRGALFLHQGKSNTSISSMNSTTTTTTSPSIMLVTSKRSAANLNIYPKQHFWMNARLPKFKENPNMQLFFVLCLLMLLTLKFVILSDSINYVGTNAW